MLVPAIAALGSAFVAMKVSQFTAFNDAKKCHRLRFHRYIKEWSVAATIAKVPSVCEVSSVH